MAEVSGPKWSERFPGSKSPDALLPDFRGCVWAFISAMERGGASVVVTATYRPPERAYLMHWCWRIANGGYAPHDVPHMAKVDIDWTHRGDGAAARAAARAMVQAFDLDYAPALDSRHCHRRAVDMTIAWHDTLTILDFEAREHRVNSTPRDGTNRELIHVGATFRVLKLVSDPPHWSDDGH
jgi:hypothetical protein